MPFQWGKVHKTEAQAVQVAQPVLHASSGGVQEFLVFDWGQSRGIRSETRPKAPRLEEKCQIYQLASTGKVFDEESAKVGLKSLLRAMAIYKLTENDCWYFRLTKEQLPVRPSAWHEYDRGVAPHVSVIGVGK